MNSSLISTEAQQIKDMSRIAIRNVDNTPQHYIPPRINFLNIAHERRMRVKYNMDRLANKDHVKKPRTMFTHCICTCYRSKAVPPHR